MLNCGGRQEIHLKILFHALGHPPPWFPGELKRINELRKHKQLENKQILMFNLNLKKRLQRKEINRKTEKPKENISNSILLIWYCWFNTAALILLIWYCWFNISNSILLIWYCWFNISNSILLIWYCWFNTATLILLNWYCWFNTAHLILLI